MDVLGYARVSTKKQITSLRNQEETIKDFCNKNGLNLVKLYSEVVSAKKLIIQRPQGRLLYEHSQKDDLCVIVTFQDRLTRDHRDSRYLGYKDVITIYEDPNKGLCEALKNQIELVFASYYGGYFKKAMDMLMKNSDLRDDFYDIIVNNYMIIDAQTLIPFLKKRLPFCVVQKHEPATHISFNKEAA